MKGYYTVKLVGEGFSAAQRMAIEAEFARVLEARLGGHDQATQMILESSTSADIRQRMQVVCGEVEAAVRGAMGLGASVRFAVQACSAVDLG